MKLEQKTWQFIEKFHMLQAGAGVVVGLSGGADSVALLEVLCELRASRNLRIAAVHVHHGIRTEAQEDADFCKKLCSQKKVDFFLEYVDVPELAKSQGLSLEEAGRKARYSLFEQYRKKLAMDVVAVAHHQNDQAETMLFQLFRGSGLRGISGMAPKNETIIRPLLAVTRAEIEAFLEEKNLPYVTDATNNSDDYARNKLRHHVLPVAEELCPGAVSRMSQTASQLKEILEFMEIQVTEFLDKYAVQVWEKNSSQEESPKASLQISVEALQAVHPALQKMIVAEAIVRVFESRKDITEKHMEGVLALLSKEGEKTLHLPKGGQVTKSYRHIIFRRRENANTEQSFEKLVIEPNRIYLLPDGTILETELFSAGNLENIPKNNCTKWFDYDKIKDILLLRNREQGDYLTIRDDGARKSLQDYLVNEKVPKAERDKLLVLAEGSHIVWVLGKRISAYYKVTEHTKKILQIHIGGKNHG